MLQYARISFFSFQMNHLADIIPSLLAAEKVILASNNWRLQEELMTNLSCLPKCFTSDAIFSRIIPMIYKNVQKAVSFFIKITCSNNILEKWCRPIMLGRSNSHSLLKFISAIQDILQKCPSSCNQGRCLKENFSNFFFFHNE